QRREEQHRQHPGEGQVLLAARHAVPSGSAALKVITRSTLTPRARPGAHLPYRALLRARGGRRRRAGLAAAQGRCRGSRNSVATEPLPVTRGSASRRALRLAWMDSSSFSLIRRTKRCAKRPSSGMGISYSTSSCTTVLLACGRNDTRIKLWIPPAVATA